MQFTEEDYGIIEGIVGRFSIEDDLRSDSPRTGVIKIKTNEGDMFVKMHNRLSRWHPEVYAYENWIPVIGNSAPKLIGKFNDAERYGIIMTPLDGKTINEWKTIDEEKLIEAYFKAGEALRELHKNFKGNYFGIPTATGEPFDNKAHNDPTTYIVDTLEESLKKGIDKGLFNQKEQSLVEWCIKESQLFKNAKPVPTNWDYSPNNWMLNDRGEFIGIIDFENMLWGIDFDSFGIIIERYTQDQSNLMQSFLDGYGFEKSEENDIKLKIISTKMAIADIMYGEGTQFERAIVLGRKLLNKLSNI